VTSAAVAGASERAIMNQTGHRSAVMVRRYIRDAELVPGECGGAGGAIEITLSGQPSSVSLGMKECSRWHYGQGTVWGTPNTSIGILSRLNQTANSRAHSTAAG
jgi:hypothetical protein